MPDDHECKYLLPTMRTGVQPGVLYTLDHSVVLVRDFIKKQEADPGIAIDPGTKEIIKAGMITDKVDLQVLQILASILLSTQ